jgi:non-homologous end joining protein Ku
MAPRANWKGFLRLSLVTCPVALFPATSESEKVSFNYCKRRRLLPEMDDYAVRSPFCLERTAEALSKE